MGEGGGGVTSTPNGGSSPCWCHQGSLGPPLLFPLFVAKLG